MKPATLGLAALTALVTLSGCVAYPVDADQPRHRSEYRDRDHDRQMRRDDDWRRERDRDDRDRGDWQTPEYPSPYGR